MRKLFEKLSLGLTFIWGKEEDFSRYCHDRGKLLIEGTAETEVWWWGLEKIQGTQGGSGNKTLGVSKVTIVCRRGESGILVYIYLFLAQECKSHLQNEILTHISLFSYHPPHSLCPFSPFKFVPPWHTNGL